MAIYGNMVVPQRATGGLPTDGQTPAPYVPGQGVSGRLSTEGARLAAQAGEIQGQAAQQNARALGDLGRTLSGARVKLEDAYLRYHETKARDAYNRYVQEEMQMRPEWDKLQGSNALDEKDGVIARKSQWQSAARARYEKELGGMARRMFMRQADQYDAQTNAWALQKTNREMEAFQDSTDKGTVNLATQRAMNDPSFLPQAIGIIAAVNERRGARKGLSREAVQAQAQEDVGAMFAGAIGAMVASGDLDGARNLFAQGRRFMPADRAAMLQHQLGDAYVARVRAQVEAGDIEGARRTMEAARVPVLPGGAPAGDWNQGIAAEAQRRRGTPYRFATMDDCSGYQTQIWKPWIQDPAVRDKLFPGGRGTSEGIVVAAANLTQGGRMLNNEELAPGKVGPGMVIGLDTGPGKHQYDNRPNGMDHIVSTYMGPDGRLMVTEASGGRRDGVRGVHDTPYEQWYANNSKYRLFGATLVPLLRQGGAQAGGQGVPAGWQEYTGDEDRHDTLPARQHNPGAVKPPAGYSTFKSDAEGFLAQAKALRNEKYYGGKTIKQIVLTYVGYNPDKDYWAKVKEQGFDLEEVPDLKDNKVLARLMIGLARGESKLGNHYEPEQIYALLAGGAQGAGSQPAQAQPGGVDMDKWNKMLDAFGGNQEYAAIAYRMGIDETRRWLGDHLPEDGKYSLNSLPKDVQAFVQEVKANGGKPKAGVPAQAPAMQTPAGAFPAPAAYGAGALSPTQDAVMQAAINRGAENEAAKLLLGFKDADAKARLTGDTSMLEAIAEGLRKAGSDKAEQVQRRADFWKANEQTRVWAAGASMPQIAEELQSLNKQLEHETAKSLPVEKLEQLHGRQELLASVFQEREKALKADPALAADSNPTSGVTQGQAPMDKARTRLKWQEDQGVPELARRALTKAEAERLRTGWGKASSEQKAAMLGEFKKTYGDLAPQVLNELSISPLEQDVASAVLHNGDMTNRATEVFRIIALDPKTVPNLDENDRHSQDAVEALKNDCNVYQAYSVHASKTQDPASLAIVKSMEDFAKKAARLNKSSEEIAAMLDLGRDAFIGDNAAVVVPKGLTKDQVETALDWALDAPLRQFLEQCRPDLNGQPKFLWVQDNMERLRRFGFWVASPDGAGFILLDDTTKKPVTGSDGNFFIVTAEQAAKMEPVSKREDLY